LFFDTESAHVRSDWPRTHDPPASVFSELGLQAHVIMLSREFIYLFNKYY
jgi:hypothetical protein